jgi:hypothetical protein
VTEWEHGVCALFFLYIHPENVKMGTFEEMKRKLPQLLSEKFKK